MRIAIDISQLSYQGSGVATYTSLLVENLLRIDQENDYLLVGASLRQMDILNSFSSYCQKINKNLEKKFFLLPQKFRNILDNNLHLPWMDFFLKDVDIFHTSDWTEPNSKIKKVTTIHDLVVYKYPELSDPYIVETQKKKMFFVKKESRLIFADSITTKNDLMKILKIEEKKMAVVYPGVEEIYKKVDNDEITRIKSKYSLTDDYILAVGTIEPRKNLKRVIAAFNKFLHHQLVLSCKKPVKLVIAGKMGWDREVKSQREIKWLGTVDKIDLPGLYSGANFFIYPSIYEGFGLPVIEAMSCETPVITSNRGSLLEIAGDAAVIVDPEVVDDIAVKMVKLFFDTELKKTIREKGKKNAHRFSWQKTAREVLKYYQKVYQEDGVNAYRY